MPTEAAVCLAACYILLGMNVLFGALILSRAYACVTGIPASTELAELAEFHECPWVKFARRHHLIHSPDNVEKWVKLQEYFDSLSAAH